MILQQLSAYYNRLASDPESDLPVPGFSRKQICFALVLDSAGQLLQVRDLREVDGKKKKPKELVVPSPTVRTSTKIAPSFLWDNSGYVLGMDAKGKPERALKTFEAFRDFHKNSLKEVDDAGLRAVVSFLDGWVPENALALEHSEDVLSGGNIVFQIDGDRAFVHDTPVLQTYWQQTSSKKDAAHRAVCIVTGENSTIARLHMPIQGVRGAQSTGAPFVSFNATAFCSYGKDTNSNPSKDTSCLNAPVSEKAMFAYTTTLNHLLRKGSRQKIQIADATTVFWTSRPSPVESILGLVLDPRSTEAGDNKEVRDYLEAVCTGKMPDYIDPTVGFYLLGISPNAARLAVRFWHASTVGDINEKLRQHFRDLAIVPSSEKDPPYPGIWQILIQTAVQGKTENIPPLLGGALMQAILTGGAYPQSLLGTVVNRIRAGTRISYLHAATIKACLVRQWRIHHIQKEITMTLDPNNTAPAYVLGRLFAVLERAQKDAIPTANTTIKDRFFGAASATPRAVFPQLLRLAQHHIEKAEFGFRRDKEIEQILNMIQSFPAHMQLADQGLFAIGYYHQRHSFFAARAANDTVATGNGTDSDI